MRIGFLCYRYPVKSNSKPGGIQIFIKTMSDQLTKLGHRIVVISQEQNLEPSKVVSFDDGVKLYRFRARRWPKPRMFWQRWQFERIVRDVVRRERLDLVECFDEGGVLLWGRPGVPLVVRMHNNSIVRHRVRGQPVSLLDYFFTTRILKRADALVAVSKWVGHQTLEATNMMGAKFHVIYNGVNTEWFQPNLTTRDDDLILFAGAFSERKGFPILFDALPQVLYTFPKIKVRCVGVDRAHPQTGRLMSEEYMQRIPPKFRDCIEIAGPVPHANMPYEFQHAGLCVFPSQSEGHPFSVIEAMACGSPVIFMKMGPGLEVIEDGVDGLLCDTRRADELAKTMILAMKDKKLRQRIGANASQRIRETLSLDLVAKKNIDFYRKVLSSNTGVHNF